MSYKEQKKDEWTLTLLHTNDSHGHLLPIEISSLDISSQLRLCHSFPLYKKLGGFAYLAEAVNRIRQENDHVLLLEAGDVFCDSEIANITKGSFYIKLMNQLGYDAMTPGNHDVDYGIEVLKQRANEANFPMLAANLLEEETEAPLLGNPYMVKEINGFKIGIYGLTYHLTPETTSKKNTSGAKYTFSLETIQSDINRLKNRGVNCVIILSHLGSDLDRKMAENIEGIDVIVGGHSHEPIPKEIRNGVIISQSTPYYTGLGVLRLQFNRSSLVGAEGSIIPIIPENFQPNVNIQRMINEMRFEHKDRLEQDVGSITSPMIRNYKRESPAETFFGNILRTKTTSDISILPGIGFGVTIPPGPITLEQLTNLLPHRSSIYTVQLKGRDIVAALEQSILNQIHPDVEERVGGLIQVTGLAFVYQYSSKLKNLVLNVRVNNQPIALDQFYKVVLNQLMFEGGHKYSSLKKGQNVCKWEQTDMEMVIDWMHSNPSLPVYEEGWSKPLRIPDSQKFQKRCFPLENSNIEE
ncbi:bifunctional metallophosphatase/5'-nucleotidase [Alkalihalobacillus sp. MEB130]|uniref:bifunctional metallophosphatase/5'-nucleotidase n=1 Tax=Alkalihalobacillus sp. MEB130 TaxID=2976704 RepID=UPI0028DD6A2A|nr:bifunctional UDP-sugar hydrolase/5'-nucleotidase [Alkalihalobacillus sp. MEB130]MDT8862201.1 bifunctional metallophosphatase/5'-nucleotidase [Alkalihalobacillus sp. MEB130]